MAAPGPADQAGRARAALAGAWLDLRRAASFYTRLPLPAVAPGEAGALARALAMGPLVGLGVGAAGGLAFALAAGLGLPPLACGGLAVAATMAVTGGLHEDGLADTADAFGGGLDAESKLAILHDSRVGAFGVAALVLSVLLRAAALAAVPGWPAALAALAAAHAASRAPLPALMARLAPARASGLAAGVGRPPRAAVLAATGLGAGLALVLLGWAAGLAAVAVTALAAAAVGWLARRQIGGYTGDVLGAAQQVAEAAVLLSAAAALS